MYVLIHVDEEQIQSGYYGSPLGDSSVELLMSSNDINKLKHYAENVFDDSELTEWSDEFPYKAHVKYDNEICNESYVFIDTVKEI